MIYRGALCVSLLLACVCFVTNADEPVFPLPGYRAEWFGGTFGKPVPGSGNWGRAVPNHIGSLCTAADGTVMATSWQSDGGCKTLFDGVDGQPIRFVETKQHGEKTG